MDNTFFDDAANSWDEDEQHVARSQQVAAAIRRVLSTDHPVTAELGAGTGLLARQLADLLGPVTLLDSAPKMVAAATQAVGEREGWTVHLSDLSRGPLPGGPYELVIAQLVLHHLADVPDLLGRVFTALKPQGQVAFADLSDPGMSDAAHAHGYQGFTSYQLSDWLSQAGFTQVTCHDLGTIAREVHGEPQDFSFFLITARKP